MSEKNYLPHSLMEVVEEIEIVGDTVWLHLEGFDDYASRVALLLSELDSRSGVSPKTEFQRSELEKIFFLLHRIAEQPDTQELLDRFRTNPKASHQLPKNEAINLGLAVACEIALGGLKEDTTSDALRKIDSKVPAGPTIRNWRKIYPKFESLFRLLSSDETQAEEWLEAHPNLPRLKF